MYINYCQSWILYDVTYSSVHVYWMSASGPWLCVSAGNVKQTALQTLVLHTSIVCLTFDLICQTEEQIDK